MRRVKISIASLLLASAVLSALSDTNTFVVVDAKQTDIVPQAGLLYRLAPGQLYATTEPGPKERDKSMAWSTANEFVFRTALRNQCALPGTGAIQHKTGVMVLFEKKESGKKLHVFVRSDKQAIEYKE